MNDNEEQIRQALASAMQSMKSGQPRSSNVQQTSRSATSSNKSRVVDLSDEGRGYVRSNSVSNVAAFETTELLDVQISDAVKAVFHKRVETIDMTRHAVPSKKETRRVLKRSRSDRVFQNGTGVGSSRSTTIDMLKAIHHKETGCIVLEQVFVDGKPRTIDVVPMKSTTDRSATGRQIVGDLSHTAESFANLVRKIVQNDRCDGTEAT